MSTTETPELWEPAELPAFDEARLRRAVRRGVIRTAVRGAVIVFVGLIIVSISGALIQSALDRRNQLDDLAVAWQVAHPDYTFEESNSDVGGWSTNATLDAHPVTAGEATGSTPVHLHLNMFGSLNLPTSPTGASATPVLQGMVFGAGASPVAAERKRLSALPDTTVVGAVVEFASPLSSQDYARFVGPFELGGLAYAPVLFDVPGAQGDRGTAFDRGILAWSPTYDHFFMERGGTSDPVGEFRTWVRRWHNSDSGNLHNVGIDLTALRDAAHDGRIRGVIATQQSPRFLLRMLSDPRVGAVHVFDVTFATEATGQN